MVLAGRRAMRLLLWVSGLGVLLLGVTVTPARAASDTVDVTEGTDSALFASPAWDSRRLILAAQLGFASPGGLVGLEAEVGLAEWLSVGAGAGPSLKGDLETARQVGFWATPRFLFDSSALGADLGFSMGSYEEARLLDEHAPSKVHDNAVWLNAAARYHYLSDGGFSFRTFLGAAVLANPGDGECTDGVDPRECDRLTLGFIGAAVGYAFYTGS
jgi:hypothetical protein